MKVLSVFASLVGVSVLALQSLGATTYYVSKTGSNGDGKDWSTAKTTIQAAINLCSTSGGDTVIVDDGDYSDIGATLKITPSNDSTFDVSTVVYIDRPLTLKSRNGKGKTSIIGRYGDGTAQDDSANTFPGTGKGAVRCVYATKDATISGFTIRNGSTVRAKKGINNDVDIGGGVVASSKTTYLIDCDVLDCRAGIGAAVSRDVRPIRCRFSGNIAKDSNHVAYRNSYAFNCLYENNGNGSGYIFTYVQSYKIVNCTFINNKLTAVGRVNINRSDKVWNKISAFNCAFLDVQATDISATDVEFYEFANCVQTVSGGRVSSGTACETGVSKYQYFSPASEDWSAVVGNSLVGKGDTTYLTTGYTGVPSADYLETDFTGKNSRKTGSSVAVGCFEPTMEKPLVAAVAVNGPAEAVSGTRVSLSDATASNRWFGVSAKGQVRIRYTGEGDVFGYMVSNDGVNKYSTSRFPDNGTDGGFWLTPTPDGVTTVEAIPATDEKWVDDDADEAVADGSEAKPFKTIPQAMAAVADYGVIRVKPGVYATGADNGKAHIDNGDASACRVSLWKPVAVRSSDGAEKTVLMGGSDVVTIVRPSNHGRVAQVQGFTLTGGANDPARDEQQGETGGAFYAQVQGDTSRDFSETIHVTDSIISNNVSSTRVVTGGWLERCYLCDNFTTKTNMDQDTSGSRGTQAYGSILTGCVVTYSPQYFQMGGYPTVCTSACQHDTLINCTLNIPKCDARTTPSKSYAYRTFNTANGCTVAYNSATVDGAFDGLKDPCIAAGIVSSPGATVSPWKTAFDEGTFFNDAANADYRPIAGCAGASAGAEVGVAFVRYETGDFNGQALAYQENGATIPGAYQVPVKLLIVSCPAQGTVTPSGLISVDDGESVTFTATVNDSAHSLVGWLVDGERVETTSLTYVYTADYAKAAFSLSPIFTTDLYVDASKTDDSGDGASPATAKKTLAAIAALAVEGDTIHAAAGDYNEGSMVADRTINIDPANKWGYSPSRVVLKKGVALVSDEGPAVTFITGNVGTNGNHLGLQAIRGVTAYENTTLRGFTIRNGATHPVTGNEYDNGLGGGVLAPKAGNAGGTAFVDDCVVSNCWARTGGNTWGGILNKCVILGGNGNSGSTCARYARLCQCVCDPLGKNTTVGYHYGIYSSTIYGTGGSNNYELNAADDATSSPIENSVLLTKCGSLDKAMKPCVLKNFKNCIWFTSGAKYDEGAYAGQYQYQLDEASSVNVKKITDRAEAGLDEAYRPTRGSIAIDAGDTALLANLPDAKTDLAGDPRVSNGCVDLGAYEYDWRGDYAAALGCGKRIQVAAASPMVRLEDPTLMIPADGELSFGWTPRIAGETATLTVSALDSGAKLLVYRGDELVNTISAAGDYEIAVAGAVETEVNLVAEGGSVSLAGFKPMRLGFSIIVR